MGIQKQKWKPEEEEALHAGVAKHGAGKWKNILRDPEFASVLSQRSNIDLKDKWRNLSVGSSGQGPKDRSRTPKANTANVLGAAVGTSPSRVTETPPAMSGGTPAATLPAPGAPNSSSAAPHTRDGSSELTTDDASKNVADANNAQWCNQMIFEALSSIKDVNGSDIGAIVSFIEQRQKVPQNFRRQLSNRLRRLVGQGKLEKVANCYRICVETKMVANTPTVKQSSSPRLTVTKEMLEDAAMTAAYKIAEAENKAFLAAEAIKEADRLARMLEESEAMLEFALDIYERCSRGEVVILE